jgi:hypothetical protein
MLKIDFILWGGPEAKLVNKDSCLFMKQITSLQRAFAPI